MKQAKRGLIPLKSPPGRPRKLFDLAKLAKVAVVTPDSLAHAIEQLLIFDSRILDSDTARELVKIVPQLLIMRRAWKAHFVEYGCISCKRKRVVYGAGGFCNACQGRIGQRLRQCFRNVGAGRDVAGELASITQKYDAAQLLLNGDDE